MTTTALFAGLDVATEKVLAKCYQRQRYHQSEFMSFLNTIEKNVQPGTEVHLILDSYSTHKAPQVKQWLRRSPHWYLHFIPTHSSWLNQIEHFFGRITNDMIRRGIFRLVPQPKRFIMSYIEENNQHPKPFKWTASADQIIGKVGSFCKGLR